MTASADPVGWETGRWLSAPSYRAHPRLYHTGCVGLSLTLPLLEVDLLCRMETGPPRCDPKLTCSEQDAIAQDNRANVQSVVADRHRRNRNLS